LAVTGLASGVEGRLEQGRRLLFGPFAARRKTIGKPSDIHRTTARPGTDTLTPARHGGAVAKEDAMFEAKHILNPQPLRPPEGRRSTKAELRAVTAAQEAMIRLQMFVHGREAKVLHVPEAWDVLAERYPKRQKRVKVTLLLDEPVAKYFRAHGDGYQGLINEVLCTYAQLRLAKLIESPMDRTPEGTPI
jgi:uncharacterized protein (DUF4415 family)